MIVTLFSLSSNRFFILQLSQWASAPQGDWRAQGSPVGKVHSFFQLQETIEDRHLHFLRNLCLSERSETGRRGMAQMLGGIRLTGWQHMCRIISKAPYMEFSYVPAIHGRKNRQAAMKSILAWFSSWGPTLCPPGYTFILVFSFKISFLVFGPSSFCRASFSLILHF